MDNKGGGQGTKERNASSTLNLAKDDKNASQGASEYHEFIF